MNLVSRVIAVYEFSTNNKRQHCRYGNFAQTQEPRTASPGAWGKDTANISKFDISVLVFWD